MIALNIISSIFNIVLYWSDRMDDKLNKSLMKVAATTKSTPLLQLPNHREELDVFASFNNSSLTGFYNGWPLCILPNSSNVNISESESDQKFNLPLFEVIISLVLLVVVALPGLVGNFISIFILSRPQMRTSLNVILIGTRYVSSFRPLVILNIATFNYKCCHAWMTQNVNGVPHPTPNLHSFILSFKRNHSVQIQLLVYLILQCDLDCDV